MFVGGYLSQPQDAGGSPGATRSNEKFRTFDELLAPIISGVRPLQAVTQRRSIDREECSGGKATCLGRQAKARKPL